MSYFNIQVSIQRVEQSNPALAKRDDPRNRTTVELLKLAVTADTEHGAYVKAMRLIQANQPELGTTSAPLGHTHGASCDDARGNHLCGETETRPRGVFGKPLPAFAPGDAD